MKKMHFAILSVLIIVSFTIYGYSRQQQPIQENVNANKVFDSNGKKVLIVYFSAPEKNDGLDAIASASVQVTDGKIVGSTQMIANMIQKSTDGELFPIETLKPYPTNHDDLVDYASAEKDRKAHPELIAHMENIKDYDIIFIGYPIWWYDLPMPLYSFLEEYDLSNKVIIPFSTHGGSSFSGTIETISKLQPKATVIEDGLTVSRKKVSRVQQDDVNVWIKELKLFD